MNLPESTFEPSNISSESTLRADRSPNLGSRFLTVSEHEHATKHVTQLLSDGCQMAMPVFARRISSLPEKQGTSNRSVTAWRLKQAEHSIGPTASEELLPLATDERTPEYSLVGLLSAMPQELLNAECGVMWSEKQRGRCAVGSASKSCQRMWFRIGMGSRRQLIVH